MADNMNKKWKRMLANQSGGDQIPFDFEFPDDVLLEGSDLYKDILSLVSKSSSGVMLKQIIVELIEKHGITFSVSEYKKKIRQMEQTSELVIDKIPPLTPMGKKTRSMDYDEYKITIKKGV
jgi:hypothetical protein